MSVSPRHPDPVVHRFAVATCLIAMLPIGIGVIVTTLRAGMAFADWPTSDGHNMLLYPWLSDLRNTDRFTEHGHRLAGIVIGLTSIALVGVTFLREKRGWVRGYTVAILVAVIAQGLLGGVRVLMDAELLAMVHSLTGALFFAQCVVFAVLTSRSTATRRLKTIRMSTPARGIVLLLPVVVLGQYLLGGMFRHLGRMMFEHLAGAALVAAWGVTAAIILLRSDQSSLRTVGKFVLAALVLQLCLGAGAWITKLNVPAFGWVVSTGSPTAVVFRSLHTIGGMFLLAAGSLGAVQLAQRSLWIGRPDQLLAELPGSKGGLT